jgi:hypothetical protein
MMQAMIPPADGPCAGLSLSSLSRLSSYCSRQHSRAPRRWKLRRVGIIKVAMLADEVLPLIKASPGISTAVIRAAFRDRNQNSIASAIIRLLDDGMIVSVAKGYYRAVKFETPEPETRVLPSWQQGSIPLPTKARMMAGR